MLIDRGVQCTYLSEDTPSLRHLEPTLAMIWYHVSTMKNLDDKSFVCSKSVPFYQLIMNHMHSYSDKNIKKHIIANLALLKYAERQNILPKGLYEQLFSAMKESQLTYPDCIANISNERVIKFYRFCERYVTVCCSYGFAIHVLSEEGTCKHINREGDRFSKEVDVLLLGNGQVCEIHETNRELSELIEEIVTSQLVFKDECKGNGKGKISVPCNLHDLVKSQIPVWISTAFEAREMQLEREYLIKENVVYPIDYNFTGIIEVNKKWGDGLQQFLEMKHSLALSPMSLITNFISNVTFFRKYQFIYGVTGTLGSDADKVFLQTVYDVSTYSIPPYMRSKMYENKGKIITQKRKWVEEICTSVKKAIQNRAVLVICEDIKTSEELKEKIQTSCQVKRMTLYTRSEPEQNRIIDRALNKGEIIISTNLAGRGTDIKVSKDVNNNGGLFVLITFFPMNKRVEQQAKGRTARNGKYGSTQIIVLRSTLEKAMQKSCSIKYARMMRERQAMHEMRELQYQYDRVIIKDKLFEKYCNFLKKIPKEEDAFVLQQITQIMHERWGILLKITDISSKTALKMLEEKLALETINLLEEYSSMGNIYFMINIGNKLMMTEKYEDAISIYNKVIKIAKKWSSIAQYNKAYCLLRRDGEKSLPKALNALTDASEQLQTYFNELTQTLTCIRNSHGQNVTGEKSNRLYTQIQVRFQLLAFFQDTIKVLIDDLKAIRYRKWTSNSTLQCRTVSSLLEGYKNQVDDEENISPYVKEFHYVTQMGIWQYYAMGKVPWFRSNQMLVCVVGVTQIAAGSLLMYQSCGHSKGMSVQLIELGIRDILDCSKTFDPLQNVSRTEWLRQKSIKRGNSCLPSVSNLVSIFRKGSNTKVDANLEDICRLIITKLHSAIDSDLKKNDICSTIMNVDINKVQQMLAQIIQSIMEKSLGTPDIIVMTIECFLHQKQHERRHTDVWMEIEHIFSDIVRNKLNECLQDKKWQIKAKSVIETLTDRVPISQQFKEKIINSEAFQQLTNKCMEDFHNLAVKRFNIVNMLWNLNKEFVADVQKIVSKTYISDRNRNLDEQAKRFLLQKCAPMFTKAICDEVQYNFSAYFRISDYYYQCHCDDYWNVIKIIVEEIEADVQSDLKVNLATSEIIDMSTKLFLSRRQNRSNHIQVWNELEELYLNIICLEESNKNDKHITLINHLVSTVVQRLIKSTELDGRSKEVINHFSTNVRRNKVYSLTAFTGKLHQKFLETTREYRNDYNLVDIASEFMLSYCAKTITNIVFIHLDDLVLVNNTSDIYTATQFKEDVLSNMKDILRTPTFLIATLKVLISTGEREVLHETQSIFTTIVEECVESNWQNMHCINTNKDYSPNMEGPLGTYLYDLTVQIFNKFSITNSDDDYQQLWRETDYFLSVQCSAKLTKIICDTIYHLLVAPLEETCSQAVTKSVNALMAIA